MFAIADSSSPMSFLKKKLHKNYLEAWEKEQADQIETSTRSQIEITRTWPAINQSRISYNVKNPQDHLHARTSNSHSRKAIWRDIEEPNQWTRIPPEDAERNLACYKWKLII